MKVNQDLSFEERLDLLKALNGIGGDETAPDDEQYAIFTNGDYADQQFRRIARPSYGQRIEVEELRMKAKGVPARVKEAICEELGWDPEERSSEELSMIDFHEKVLPLITRENLPKDWAINDVSSYEVQRMLNDFLLGT